MGRINLQSLIDEVLNMVKENQTIRKKKSESSQSWDDTEAGQSYWKDIRARNTDIEKQKLLNEGGANIATINDTGATARQRLAGASNEKVADITAGANRYAADMGLRGHEAQAEATKYQTDKAAGLKGGGDPLRDMILEGIKQGTIDPTDTERMNVAVTNLRRITAQAPAGDDKDSLFTAETKPATAGLPSPTPAAGGGRSMTFQTDMGTAPKNPLREKVEAEDSFYRLNPQLKRKKKDSFFSF